MRAPCEALPIVGGRQLYAAGHPPSTIRHRPSDTGHPPPAIRRRPSAVHHLPPAIRRRTSTTGRPSAVGHLPLAMPSAICRRWPPAMPPAFRRKCRRPSAASNMQPLKFHQPSIRRRPSAACHPPPAVRRLPSAAGLSPPAFRRWAFASEPVPSVLDPDLNGADFRSWVFPSPAATPAHFPFSRFHFPTHLLSFCFC